MSIIATMTFPRSFFSSHRPILYFIYDSGLNDERRIKDIVESAIENGVDVIQYRHKSTCDDKTYQTARQLKQIIANRVPFLVNDHVELAQKIDADGVHIGQGDMKVSEARSIIGYSKVLGLTAFTRAHMAAFDQNDVDYVGTGPFYPTLTDKGKPVLGAQGFAEIAACSPVPVVGIGGITPDNARHVIDAGANGIAVMRGISGAEDIAASVRAYKQALS